MLKTTFIYGLVDPRDNQLRYVGKSNDPEKRLKQHYTEHYKKGHNPYLRRWLNVLSANYLVPEIIVLDKVPSDNWQRYEIDWIASMKAALGKRIINIHGGGIGGNTMSGRKHKESTKEKMRQAAIGNRENRVRAGKISWKKDPTSKIRQGADVWNSKLTEKEAREIFNIYNQGGITQPKLAARYDISRQLVSEIIRGNAWKHLKLLKGGDANDHSL